MLRRAPVVRVEKTILRGHSLTWRPTMTRGRWRAARLVALGVAGAIAAAGARVLPDYVRALAGGPDARVSRLRGRAMRLSVWSHRGYDVAREDSP
jgi:hypothetical protein